MTDLQKRAIVVGASSGIGEAMVKKLVREGFQVGMVARRKPELDTLQKALSNGSLQAFAYPFDVTRYDKTASLFDEIVTRLGGLDLVVYAAGVMPAVEADEYSFEKDKQMVDVNVLGATAWLNEAAQYFTRVKHGTIVGISSVAGDRGRRGNPMYCASKAAINTYLESLRNRLDMHGVHVLTIKPGFVDTAMTRGKPGLFWLITAEEAARRIYEAAQKRKNTAYVPGRWRALMTVIQMIPSFIFKKLDI